MEKPTKLDRSLRDLLAIDRTRLANQRTLLAFVVTTTHFVALGITFSKVKDLSHLKWLSLPMFILAAFVLTIGLLSYAKVKRDIGRAYGHGRD